MTRARAQKPRSSQRGALAATAVLERRPTQRFVLANRRAGKFRASEKVAARHALSSALSTLSTINVVSDNNPSDPTARRVVVFDADPEEIAATQTSLPSDALLEPEILHWPEALPPADFLPLRHALGIRLAAASTPEFEITVTAGGEALANAAVSLYVRGLGGSQQELRAKTDRHGRCRFSLPGGFSASALVIVPAGGYWPMVVRGPASGSIIDCPALQMTGPIGWWHTLVGINKYDPTAGSGIKVGVIDTGVGPHANLDHVTLAGAFLDGGHMPGAATADVDVHGTHVSGTIGARPQSAGEFAGIAPGCELVAARVFPGPDQGANQGDIANAIDALSRDHQVDLINMSLGSTQRSQIEQDAILDALERGTLCICAAGNDGGNVNYPGAFPEAISVSALGQLGTAPSGSLSASRLPTQAEFFGHDNLFLANFSSRGANLTCAAPGVGIIAAVPGGRQEDLHAAMDGTSMASPIATGILAVILKKNRQYQLLPRDSSRALAARGILNAACRDIGLNILYQGRGVPYA